VQRPGLPASGDERTFEAVEFEDTPDENVVFLEGPSGDFISDDPEETDIYLKVFKRITEKSLSAADSMDRLRAAGARWHDRKILPGMPVVVQTCHLT
jgi:hypothetical protein